MYLSSPIETIATFSHMVSELDKLGIAWIQLSQYNSEWTADVAESSRCRS